MPRMWGTQGPIRKGVDGEMNAIAEQKTPATVLDSWNNHDPGLRYSHKFNLGYRRHEIGSRFSI